MLVNRFKIVNHVFKLLYSFNVYAVILEENFFGEMAPAGFVTEAWSQITRGRK